MNVLEKILEEIKNLKAKQDSENQDYCTGYLSALSTIEGIVSGVKENNDWIPVSERLPEKAGTYIVSAKDGKREIVTFVKWQNRFKKWDLSGARAYWKINAWKPLPEPYKGEWY